MIYVHPDTVPTEDLKRLSVDAQVYVRKCIRALVEASVAYDKANSAYDAAVWQSSAIRDLLAEREATE